MRNTVFMILLLLVCSVASAQWRPNPYYYNFKGVKADSVLILPRDTIHSNAGNEPDSARLAYKNGKLWMRTASKWVEVSIGKIELKPDRVYQPGISMPPGATIENDNDPMSPTFGWPVILKDPYLNGLDYTVHLRGLEYAIKGQEWQNDVSGGGFRWTDGRIFEDGMVVTVSFKPVLQSP